MKDLLTFILEAIVEKPEQVNITVKEDNGIVNIDFSVDKEDMGRVIGKNGKVIKAIRNVLRILALKEGKKVNLVLLEE